MNNVSGVIGPPEFEDDPDNDYQDITHFIKSIHHFMDKEYENATKKHINNAINKLKKDLGAGSTDKDGKKKAGGVTKEVGDYVKEKILKVQKDIFKVLP